VKEDVAAKTNDICHQLDNAHTRWLNNFAAGLVNAIYAVRNIAGNTPPNFPVIHGNFLDITDMQITGMLEFYGEPQLPQVTQMANLQCFLGMHV